MKNKINFFSLLIYFIVFYILYYLQETRENFDTSIKNRTLNNDGFCILYNPNYASNTFDKPSNELANDVLNNLPKDYVFIDYVYKIKNASLSTFHRDVTSSKNIYKTKYPIYTLILYKYDGDLLSLCPNSNKTYPFVLSRIVTINGKSGTAFLFDSDLLHAGTINNCKKRELIQYKLCHKDDLMLLSNLHNIRKEKTAKCNDSYYEYYYQNIMRNFSYFFEFPINYIFYPLMIKRENSNTVLGFVQSFIPIEFYNN